MGVQRTAAALTLRHVGVRDEPQRRPAHLGVERAFEAAEHEVRLRPEGNANADLPTGAVEVVASTLEVLNAAAPLPFQIDERVTVGEEARLKYRYLDLRRPGPGAAIRLRSKVNAAAREVLAGHDFVEIETPTMTRSTPEGARDFIVPALSLIHI